MKIAHDPEELIALVDENDTVIGKYPRRNHADGQLHREVFVFIVNQDRSQLLCQRRKDNGKLTGSASGHFPYDQTYLEGAERETLEELGLEIGQHQFTEIAKFRVESVEDGIPTHRFITLYEVVGDYPTDKMKLDLSEVKSVRYYSFEELKKK